MGLRPTIHDINNAGGTAIEIGCGPLRKRKDYVTIDLQDLPSVDIIGDAREILGKLNDNTVTAVFTSHFLEHIDDVSGFLAELARVSCPGATWEIVVPHFSNPWYYSDVTHKGLFGLYSFAYLAEDHVEFTRKVPGYARIQQLRLKQVKLGFGSIRDWPIRHYSRKVFQKLVNSSTWSKEFYEDCLTGWIPCYELTYFLTIDKE